MTASFVPPRPEPFDIAPGTLLGGKYRVERVLGAGAMGTVVVATHLQLDQRFAVKFMHPVHAGNPEGVGRFLREAQAAARIQSEHVARVSDVGTLENGAPYFVMEYLRGQNLGALLRVAAPFPVTDSVTYALEACEGLAEAHAVGIIHRDLKPENLFLSRSRDGSYRVKLLDFGISKLVPRAGSPADGHMTGTEVMMGSPAYMAPEQMRSTRDVDFRADIWSLGVILYEMLGGRPPFDGATLPVLCANILREDALPLPLVRPDLPAGLAAAVMRCLEKEPERRFLDVAEFAQALAPFAPEGAARAARIERIVRSGAAGSSDALPELSQQTVPRAPALRTSTQTSASETLLGRPPRRTSLVVFVLVALTLVGAGAFALVTTDARRSGTAVDAPLRATVTVAAAGHASSMATETDARHEPEPVVTPVPSSATTVTPDPVAATTASIRPAKPARLLPATTKPASTKPLAAKPTSTNAFGGRD